MLLYMHEFYKSRKLFNSLTIFILNTFKYCMQSWFKYPSNLVFIETPAVADIKHIFDIYFLVRYEYIQ